MGSPAKFTSLTPEAPPPLLIPPPHPLPSQKSGIREKTPLQICSATPTAAERPFPSLACPWGDRVLLPNKHGQDLLPRLPHSLSPHLVLPLLFLTAFQHFTTPALPHFSPLSAPSKTLLLSTFSQLGELVPLLTASTRSLVQETEILSRFLFSYVSKKPPDGREGRSQRSLMYAARQEGIWCKSDGEGR